MMVAMMMGELLLSTTDFYDMQGKFAALARAF